MAPRQRPHPPRDGCGPSSSVPRHLVCAFLLVHAWLTPTASGMPAVEPKPASMTVVEARDLADRVDVKIAQQHPEVVNHLRFMEDPDKRLNYLATIRDGLKKQDGSIPASGNLFLTDPGDDPKAHDMPDHLSRNLVSPVSHITAFNCSSNTTIFSTVSLLQPKICDTPKSMYKPGVNATLQVLARARLLPVMMTQCQLRISETVHRCGFDSVHYGSRKIANNKPIHLTPPSCRQAMEKGRLLYDGQTFPLNGNNTEVTRTWYSIGYLDADHHCAHASFTRRVDGKQQLFEDSYLEVEGTFVIRQVRGMHNPHTNMVVWDNGIVAHYPDTAAFDHLEGTMVWDRLSATCDRTMDTLYQGIATIRKLRTNHGHKLETRDLVIIHKRAEDVYAAFVVEGRDQQCGESVIRTQLGAVVIHELDFGRGPIQVAGTHITDLPQIQTDTGHAFHHVNGNLQYNDRDDWQQQAVCAAERSSISGFLSMAADENGYSLFSRYGEGYSIARAGAVIHIGQCPPVSARLRQAENCTQEIPVVIEGRDAWVDAITRNLVDYPTIIPCDPLNPVTFQIDGRWLCATPHMHICPEPLELAPSSDQSRPDTFYEFASGQSRGIVTQDALNDHMARLHVMNARDPALADMAKAYDRYHEPDRWSFTSTVTDGNVPMHRGISPYLTEDILKRVTNHVGMKLWIFYRLLGEHGMYIVSILVMIMCIWGIICAFWRCFKVYELQGCGCNMIEAFFSTSGMLLRMPFYPMAVMYKVMVKDPNLKKHVSRHQHEDPFTLTKWLFDFGHSAKRYKAHLGELDSDSEDGQFTPLPSAPPDHRNLRPRRSLVPPEQLEMSERAQLLQDVAGRLDQLYPSAEVQRMRQGQQREEAARGHRRTASGPADLHDDPPGYDAALAGDRQASVLHRVLPCIRGCTSPTPPALPPRRRTGNLPAGPSRPDSPGSRSQHQE